MSRVLLVTGHLGPGGTERAVMTLARGLQRRGCYRPTLALLGRGGEHAEALRRDGIDVFELGIARRMLHPRSLAALARLRRFVRDGCFDIVHTFLFDADLYGMLAAVLGGAPRVITTRRAIKSRKPHHLRGYRMTNWLVDAIVCNSSAVRAFTIEREAPAPQKVLSIPNGVDAAVFAPSAQRDERARALRERLGIAADQQVIGTAGTIKWVKGQAVLFEAVRPLLEQRDDLALVLAGTAEGPYADELRRTVGEAGLAKRVHLPGSIEDVPAVLGALDVFTLPSMSEGMSNALLEAMAAGLPIVATDVGGNRECLLGGDAPAGLIVAANDSEALRTAIRSLLHETETARALAAAARARAERVFDVEKLLARTELVYKRVCGERAESAVGEPVSGQS